VHQELSRLLEARVSLEIRREGVVAGRCSDLPEEIGDVVGIHRSMPDRIDQPTLEGGLELASGTEDPRVPLELVAHARESPVMQLVGEVEREMEVVVAQRIFG
jgi:hypothetical protein